MGPWESVPTPSAAGRRPATPGGSRAARASARDGRLYSMPEISTSTRRRAVSWMELRRTENSGIREPSRRPRRRPRPNAGACYGPSWWAAV
jgi:hypothetical protein